MIFKYISFAIFSILANLFCQFIILTNYNGLYNLQIAMFSGTLVSLSLKYFLDRKYIYYYSPKYKNDEVAKFVLYSFMGIITTIIYWGFEWVFDYLFTSEYVKYIGAILGLSLGYCIKFALDRNYVFYEKS